MRVIIQNAQEPAIEKDALIYSVVVSKNQSRPFHTQLARCPKCGYSIGQVQGKIISCSPGIIPGEEVKVIHRCYKCHTDYIFFERSSNSHSIRVTLPQPQSHFCCMLCKHDVNCPRVYPQKVQCSFCPTQYLVDLA